MGLHNATTIRTLNEKFCKADRSFNTTYNGEKDVPPFVGIMFEMSSFIDVEIITFEIDIRWDMKPTNLSVQVFTIDGHYAEHFNNSLAWDALASTEIVLAPEGNSGIIPASDFTSVSIKALKVRSFYITMTGPYIDHTVYGLQKTGDIHTKGDDIQLYVGSGFTKDNFPGEIDKVLDPQFAGVVHYKKAYQCDDNQAKSTLITFQFLIDSKGIDDSFVLRYNSALDAAVDNLFETSSTLKTFIKDFGLHKSNGATTVKESFAGDCPSDWNECTAIVLRSTLRFSHMNALETSSIQFALYSADTATKVITTIQENLSTQKDIANVGFESVSAQMEVRIKGVPIVSIIDDVQVRYFEDTTQQFLDRFTGRMAVFGAILDAKSGQSGTHMLRRHLVDGTVADSEIRFNVEVQGAYPIGASADEYIDSINLACRAQQDVFVSLFNMNGVRPSEISEGDRLEYFQSIDSISCGIDKASQSPPPSASTTNSSLTKNIVIGVVLCLSILIATMYWIWQIHKRRKKREEEAKYREERKEERRLRRLERSKSELSMYSGTNSEIDMDKSEKERSVDGLLNKRETRRSDCTSSVSISLHSLDSEHSPSPSKQLDSPQGKSNLNAIFFSPNDPNAMGDHHIPGKTSPSQRSEVPGKGQVQKLSSRSKSLSPYSHIRRTVRPFNLGHSQDLSFQKYRIHSHDGLQSSNQPANGPVSLGKFIDKDQNRQPQSSRGCATVDVPVSKVSNRLSSKSIASDEKPEKTRLRYKAPPVSQHRDPNLKYQCSNRSLDGLPLRVSRTGNSSSVKKDHQPHQTRESYRGGELFNRSLDLSDVTLSHNTTKNKRRSKTNVRPAANPALHQSLSLNDVMVSHCNREDYRGSKTNVRPTANPALHRSLDLSGFNDTRDNSKAIRAQKLNTRPAANPAFHRSVDLHDVDVSLKIPKRDRGSTTNVQPAANQVLRRSLDYDLSGVDKSFKGTKPNKTEQRNGANLSNNLSKSDHGSVRNVRTPIARTRSTIENNVPNNRPRPAQPGTEVTGNVQVHNRDHPINDSKNRSMSDNIRSPATPRW